MICPPGLMIASNSLTASDSLSRCICVAELLGTSTSSAIKRSARLPVICPVIPTDLTEGEISGIAGATSNKFCVSLFPLEASGIKCSKKGRTKIILLTKMALASALSLEAEIISTLSCGFLHKDQTQ